MELNKILIAFITFSIISGLLGMMIAITNILFFKKEDKKEELVYKMLPGYNCGACGQPGCLAFSKELIKNKDEIYKCKPMKKEQRDEIIRLLNNN